MSEGRDEIADLYYRSNTVQFGEFELSAHRDNPDLPKSPWYMHYPKNKEPGSELLPEMYDLIGAEFHDYCEARGYKPDLIAGFPRGAWPLGRALAKTYPEVYPHNLLTFDKIETPGLPTEFTGPMEYHRRGEELLAVEDHTSGGRNKKLFLPVARNAGLIVNKVLTVVDREQGGVENLRAEGVELWSIFTATQLLQHGLQEGHITQAVYDRVQEYREQNPL